MTAAQPGEARPVAAARQGEARLVRAARQGEARLVTAVREGARPVAAVQQGQRDTMHPPLITARLRVDAIPIHPVVKHASGDHYR